jgi:hypothetical protein
MNRFFEQNGTAFEINVVKDNLRKLVSADLTAALSKTDWYIIRSLDSTSQKSVPSQISEQRLAARTLATTIESKIDAAGSISDLQEIYTSYL